MTWARLIFAGNGMARVTMPPTTDLTVELHMKVWEPGLPTARDAAPNLLSEMYAAVSHGRGS